jgi:hypothetical protein
MILSVGAASRFVSRGCEARRFPSAGDPVAPDSAALAALDPVGMVALALMAPRIPVACGLAALCLTRVATCVPTALDLTAPDPAACGPADLVPTAPDLTAPDPAVLDLAAPACVDP